ncbi:MAG: hypothetical protein HOH19_13595 [Kordiimonadaceae bacterium]|jgi:hypothetical protein|nr:hypothetical protein [Kordiimonadaceae bacterium]MBT6033605.1 hypothetical protein [Kordiimonadaceae bacterium]
MMKIYLVILFIGLTITTSACEKGKVTLPVVNVSFKSDNNNYYREILNIEKFASIEGFEIDVRSVNFLQCLKNRATTFNSNKIECTTEGFSKLSEDNFKVIFTKGNPVTMVINIDNYASEDGLIINFFSSNNECDICNRFKSEIINKLESKYKLKHHKNDEKSAIAVL